MIQSLEAALVRNEEICRILEGMLEVNPKELTDRRGLVNELRELILTLRSLPAMKENDRITDVILFNYMFKRELSR